MHELGRLHDSMAYHSDFHELRRIVSDPHTGLSLLLFLMLDHSREPVRFRTGAGAGAWRIALEAVDLSYSRSFSRGFPHDFFRWLREEEPVWWHEPTAYTPGSVGFWVVSRYEDIVAVFKDAETYSSELGGVQIYDGKGAGYQLNQTDDPKHRRLRSLVNTGFTPRMIGRLEEDLRRRARRILDEVPRDTTFNFVPTVARELPLQAICAVLGVPQEDRAELSDIVDLAVSAGDGQTMSVEHLKLLSAYADKLVERKRREPADDILSIIVHARLDDGSQLRESRAAGFLQSALSGRSRDHPQRDLGRAARVH